MPFPEMEYLPPVLNRLSAGVFLAAAIMLALLVGSAAAEPVAGSGLSVHHLLHVEVVPSERRFSAEDSLTFSEGIGEFFFVLHRGLDPVVVTSGVRLTKIPSGAGDHLFEHFRADLPAGTRTIVLRYGGELFHEVGKGREEARGISDSPGIISEEGVYLTGRSGWYPLSTEGFVTFDMEVVLPAGWDAVSQGDRRAHERTKEKTVVGWMTQEPQEEIFLVAAKYAEYRKEENGVTAMVFLRSPDESLANRYLDATLRYIEMYGRLIGPYPYRKFALVENFWETGFGMPSFTLLGSTVIRLPFIIESSYPHEILHNWWGNSVYPDPMSGNWSEGLTAYLSDHLLKEQQGQGAEYRETTLQKYLDYASRGRDFPLSAFRSRHSPASEAIGYGKSLLFFHMLRQRLGDGVFVAALRDFFEKNRFRRASFGDLMKSFSAVSGKDLSSDFRQWLERTGAPELRLGGVEATAVDQGYRLTVAIEQVQEGEAYRLDVPIAVSLEGRAEAYQTSVSVDAKRVQASLLVPSRPIRVDLDPEFDLFRKLDLAEIPPAISQALGARAMSILLPSASSGEMREAYRRFGEALRSSGPDDIEVLMDDAIEKMPRQRSVVIIGRENRFFDYFRESLAEAGGRMDRERVMLGTMEVPLGEKTVILTARSAEDKKDALMFVSTNLAGALPGLSRKLPHYHKYSYLVFDGTGPENVVKGRWGVAESPLTAVMTGDAGSDRKIERGRLRKREPLIRQRGPFSQERMKEIVAYLAGDELKGRGYGSRELAVAGDFIAREFSKAGLQPAGDTGEEYFQTWEETDDRGATTVLRNVVGVIPGGRKELGAESVVVGAHYDHLGLGWPDVREENIGRVHPGADDNASGVAVLIELAKIMAGQPKPERSIVFVAFTAEEAGKKGSRHFVRNMKRYPPDRCIAMINLDTVGRLGQKRVLALGAETAAEWPGLLRGAGYVTGVEIETAAERLDTSDQISFEEAGIPAVQLSTGPHPEYHRPSDRADRIDYEGMVKIAALARETISYLAGRDRPLTSTLRGGTPAGQEHRMERKISLGTIPDFSFAGGGCRISGVMPGSPAEVCGLRGGDIITGIDGQSVRGLRDLSEILKTLEPGRRIRITFLRDGLEMTAETEVRSR